MKLNYFTLDEFRCPCCGEVHMNEKFLYMLDLARTTAGIPFAITSGYRCEKHNKEVGGKPNSAHLKGYAVDIACSTSSSRYAILYSLIKAGFNRIGIADSFIHCDIDPDLPKNVIWTYN